MSRDEMRRALGEAPLPDPDASWQAIRRRVDAQRGQRRQVPTGWAIAAGFAAILLGVAGGTYRQFAAPSRWLIADGGGSTAADAASSANALDTSWTEVAADTLRITVGRIGELRLAPGSRARIARGAWNEHRLVLARGALDAVIAAPPRLFFVETPSALATDLGCAYRLEVRPDGGTSLQVTVGWVELSQGNARALVPAGLRAHVRADGTPEIPYAPTLPDSAVAALSRLATRGSAADLETVLSALDDADAGRPANIRRQTSGITLWHLLQRVEPAERARVAAALAQREPRPAGVTTEGILALDRQMLDRWRRALHPMWGESPGPAWAVVAQRIWLWVMD